jgi:hypothetical protein
MTKAVFSEERRNLSVKGDLARRVVPIALDPGVERPNERSGFRHADLLAWVREERARLVVAGLTVLAWYVREGRESSKPP